METLTRYLLKLEEKVRCEKKSSLAEQSRRLGKLTVQRSGSKFIEVWEEGDSFKKIHARLVSSLSLAALTHHLFLQRDIMKEKEDIEKHKRTKKSKRKAENEVGGLDYDFSFDESEYFSKIDPAEQKEILTFKLQLL